jgi:hypothetical protein
VLATLEQTSVPTTLVTLTNTAGAAPSICRVHLESTNPRRFKLFLFWVPSKLARGATYSWFVASLGTDVVEDSFHTGYANRGARKSQVLRSHAGDVLSRPSERCEVLMNGYLRLLPAT